MHVTWRARLGAVAQILIAAAGLLIASALIGTATASLPTAWATPIRALALWGGVGAGAWLLRRSGRGYADLGLRRPASWGAALGWAVAGFAIALAGSLAIGEAVRQLTDWPPLDIGYIRAAIHGNTLAWLAWLALVVWGSAAFGEELLLRGFVLDRFWQAAGCGRGGLVLAMLLQAALFGSMHAVQGPAGILVTGYVGLVFAGVWLASGRSLWAPILAHGIADTISLTLIYAGLPLPGYIG